MRRFAFYITLGASAFCLCGCTDPPSAEKTEWSADIQVDGIFQGYGNEVEKNIKYKTGLKLSKEAERNAYIEKIEFVGGNWQGKTEGFTLLVDKDELVDVNGDPLVLGSIYFCHFQDISKDMTTARFVPKKMQ